MAEQQETSTLIEQPFVQHLIELRDRLLRVVLLVTIIFLALFSFANDLYTFLAEPLMRHMPENTSMIATEVASPFLTPFKLTLVLSVFIAVPFILYQGWGFIAPGLYQRERKLVFPLLFSSTLLFYAGMSFAYFVVFPLVFGFLTGIVPEGVAVMTDISLYLDFVLKMFFAFGLAFEVPIATILLVWSGISTAENLAKKRPYIIVGAFVFGMLLTPPDIISQTLLAVPMWILFELGLLFSKWYTKKPSDEKESPVGSAVDNNPGGSSTVAASTSSAATVDSRRASNKTHGNESGTDWDNAENDNGMDSNNSGHEEYEPLTQAEMDAELDRIDDEELKEESANKTSKNQDDTGDDLPDKG